MLVLVFVFANANAISLLVRVPHLQIGRDNNKNDAKEKSTTALLAIA